jgi:Ala-tRNA(Pro) deacylase
VPAGLLSAAMAMTPDDLLDHLDSLGLETTTHQHAAVFTVDESKALRSDMPGGHCKSLFLKDKKGQLWLVVALEDRAIDMKELRRRIGAAQLSFGKPELLAEVLAVEPGSVTPFALVNDLDHRVNVILDAEMMTYDPLNYHPLINTATTAIAPADLLAFIAECGHQARVVEL